MQPVRGAGEFSVLGFEAGLYGVEDRFDRAAGDAEWRTLGDLNRSVWRMAGVNEDLRYIRVVPTQVPLVVVGGDGGKVYVGSVGFGRGLQWETWAESVPSRPSRARPC